MDLLASSVDIAFLLLALLVIYKQPLSVPVPSHSHSTPEDATVPLPQSPHSSHPSPGYLAVPSINVSPPTHKPGLGLGKLPLPPAGGAKASRHKKKTVSFSLSSMDDLKSSSSFSEEGGGEGGGVKGFKKFRPPTPFFKSPGKVNLEMSPISPGKGCGSPGLQSPSIKIDDFDVDRERELGMDRELEGVELEHGILREDSMGSQKRWLVAGV
ncbi:hypothetical protein I302_108842 [Kwoniella bestiolae CBS 10118]|uniref:Uncharacterized protein n=1 Tax=Kwoniella bestiolae CBS 10118 TaxID=1296100 RepID=A0A1B9FU96_9TREE|nr:hypothetical protein I302_07981 [Kwoniella bestiolae CBS 10118]OCF22334.1 hypothetical protein I302_07981 [Kwoniella bestiolae CBS 10118]